jgi:hypothetical protein
MANFRPSDRLTSFLLPPSVDDWLLGYFGIADVTRQ